MGWRIALATRAGQLAFRDGKLDFAAPWQMRTVGFISPPGWADPSPAEFVTTCAEPVLVQQCPLLLPGFDWRIDSIAVTEPELMEASRALGDTGCDLVATVGTPFAWAGLGSLADARARRDRLADAAGAPVVMSGLAIIDAVVAFGAERIGLATTYYSDEWTKRWAHFVEASGVEVLAAQNLAEQGLMPPHNDADRTYWAPTAGQISECVRRIADTAPNAEVIAVSGAGSRTLALTSALEAETGRHVIGSDTALYWAIAETAGITLKPGILGTLTEARGHHTR